MSYSPQSPGSISSREEEGQSDYLQDPSLWRDILPQPYRLIDDILEEELEEIYLLIQEREEREDKKKKHYKPITETEEATLMMSLSGATRLEHLKVGESEYLLGGGGMGGLVCIELKENTHTSTPMEEGLVNSISAQNLHGEDVNILVAVGMGKDGGRILVWRENKFYNICEVSHLTCHIYYATISHITENIMNFPSLRGITMRLEQCHCR